ncbi:hypothetical protein [Novosphingobium sp. PhB165]|uniref:hypothetical protein n=1 Tax=Novosphingobium sp. PhB165 TaxID=2485105 RepID=UPI001A9FDBA6|nr:hypothetical protein [Novosphingobium sp. PhB165]
MLCGTGQTADGDDGAGEDTEIVVQATRSGRRVQDEPFRVDILDREEIEEKLLMRPGNIAMLVSETPGVRVQTTSPSDDPVIPLPGRQLAGADVRSGFSALALE